jgi:hypothetical protein
MRQTKIIVDMIQRQLLPQAILALAQHIDPPPHRRDMLADGQVEALHKRRVDLPAAGREHLLDRRKRAEHDPVWESQGLGRFAGRDAIREFFRGASQLFTFAIHYSLNGQIDVQGDTAQAQWYLFMPCTLGEGNRAMWRAGVDHEEYVRVAGEWKFKRKTSAPLFHTPFEEGWAKTRFV